MTTNTGFATLWASMMSHEEFSLYDMAKQVAEVNDANGWFDVNRSFGDEIALLHSEISEMLEAHRKDNWSGEKDSVQREAADVLIRLLDLCWRHDINLDNYFCEGLAYNKTRGYRHGNKSM